MEHELRATVAEIAGAMRVVPYCPCGWAGAATREDDVVGITDRYRLHIPAPFMAPADTLPMPSSVGEQIARAAVIATLMFVVRNDGSPEWRVAADNLQSIPPGRRLASTVSCPVCAEATCDTDCPLAGWRTS